MILQVCQNSMKPHNKNIFFAILGGYKSYFVKIFKIYTDEPIYYTPYYLFFNFEGFQNLPILTLKIRHILTLSLNLALTLI